MLFKIGGIDNQQEIAWNKLYYRHNFPDFNRLVIGCASKEITRILSMCKDMEGPFRILYLLLVSRLGNEPGRHQSPEPLSYEELELFLYKHQEFF